ncbi:MAG: ATP-binding cassette domain-containing protein [Gemmatimonadota bacterium]|nr:ATP-binding cassette domain-containing protein [Gemmatimonadota bacterium]
MALVRVQHTGNQLGRQIEYLLQDVSCEVNPHEPIGLTGSSGCGKTALLRMLTGEILADEVDVIRSGTSEAVGYLFQESIQREDQDVLIMAFSNAGRRWKVLRPTIRVPSCSRPTAGD